MIRIFLLGAYGQNNLGDEALLQVFLSRCPDAHFTVNSAQPEVTARRYGVEALYTYMRLPRFARPRALMRSDLMVFGGGSLLKEVEGGHPARLFYCVRILLLLLFCRLLGKPTAMLGVGIGPLNQPIYRRLSRLAANLCTLICVRDAASYDLLLAIGARGTVHLTADLILSLAGAGPACVPPADQLIAVDGATTPGTHAAAVPRRVVVIPRYSLTDEQQAAVADGCDNLIDQYGSDILLLPFQTGYLPRFDDVPVAEAIVARMRHAAKAEIRIVHEPTDAQVLIGAADLVLSARLHGLIFAALHAVPIVAISYEVKMRAFMAELGQVEASLELPELTAGMLPTALDRAWARRQTTGQVRAEVAKLRDRSLRNFELLDQLASRPRGGALLTGSALLLASTTIVNAGNYVFNLLLGRALGPSAFADISVIVTLMLVISFITAALGQTAARFAAIYAAQGDESRMAGLRAWMGKGSWLAGIGLLVVLILGSPLLSRFFQTASPWPFVILGLGMPVFFAQGIDRGVLQGQTRFLPLAASYQAEMWVRLIVALGLVALGLAINGAVAGLSLSFLATWLVARTVRTGLPRGGTLPRAERLAVLVFALPVSAALVGQVLINNSDVLVVKHFFAAASAGRYAALALIGRIIFFATWSIGTTMFPIVAQRQHRGQRHRQVLWISFMVVGLASLLILGATLIAPRLIVRVLFGPAYLSTAGVESSIATLLPLYALATSLYALANVVITYRLSTGAGGGSILALLAGVAQVVALWLFHDTLREVVLVQVLIMALLLAATLIWDRWLVRRTATGLGAEVIP